MSPDTDKKLRHRLSFGLIGTQLPDDLSYMLKPRIGATYYALQVSLAGVLSLLTAFYFQLESPYWAAATALLVSTPTHGQTLSKGFFRLLGTLIGGAMAVFLMAVFCQTPDLFVLCFAIWIGLCTYVGTLLRNFRMYAAALSGYTAAIIVFSSVSQPSNVLDIALARVAANSCGIVITTLVSMLFARTSALHILRVTMSDALTESADLISRTIGGEDPLHLRLRAHLLIRKITTLGTLVEYASIEAAKVKHHMTELLFVISSLMNVSTANWALSRSMLAKGAAKIAADITLKSFLDDAAVLTGRMRKLPTHDKILEFGREIGLFAKRYRQYSEEVIKHGNEESYQTLIILKNLSRVIDQLSIAQETWMSYLSGATLGRQSSFSYDINFKAALINGMRSFIAVLLAGVFWVETAWTDGSTLFMMTAVSCTLIASSVTPVRSSISFLIGGVIPSFIATCCYLFVLPYIDGFPLLAVLLAVVTFLCFLHNDPARPEMSMVFSSTAINFVMFMRFANPMDYNFQNFINSTTAMIAGMICATIAFVLIFPVLPREEISRAINRLLDEIRELATGTQAMVQSVWESRMYDRLPRIMTFLEMERRATRLLLGDFFAIIHIGVELISLKNLMGSAKADEVLKVNLGEASTQLAELGEDNQKISAKLAEMARTLFHSGVRDEKRKMEYYHAAASLYEIAYLINEHQRILVETEGGER